MPKNLFLTRAFFGIIFTLFLAVEPKLSELENKEFTFSDYLQLFSAIASASLVLMDFHAENASVYTPKGLPGRDKDV